MGIQELWKVIGHSGKEFTLEQLASNQFNKKQGKGLRVAIDTALWIFQAKSSVVGDQSELRVIFFRLCRLYELGIRPVFVFDGPNRPSYKRNRLINTMPLDTTFRTNLLDLIRLFNFSSWEAYGEAEAECAMLQRLGFVDLIMTCDSDVFLFGARRVIRQWPTKRNEPVECYDLTWITDATGLDRSDLILIALLKGSDYDVQGTQGIGIQVAVGLAKYHYHRELFDDILSIDRRHALDEQKVQHLYDNLTYELHHNTRGYIQKKYTNIQLDPKFPNFFIVNDFIHPITHIQSASYIPKAQELQLNLNYYHEPDWEQLAPFIQHTFKWPIDYVLKRFTLLAFPGYMINTLRRQRPGYKKPHMLKNTKLSSSQKAKYQTSLDNYYKLTSKARTLSRNVIIERITANKIINDTIKLYRVEWDQVHLKGFYNKIELKLDRKAYKDIKLHEDEDEDEEYQRDNVWHTVKRQWVDATLIHNVYPSLALNYQTNSNKADLFLIKPPKRCKST
ncbi:hypothetical protein G6F57_001705 [Rhizopus arrhizus]|uniref:XPG-I domain-containing protein n=1 Tax=Rhizopus oryzae TaxID=64495 RepID=A0A9P7BX21_RHIOR|nr:hypothetical protein G6F30_001359 [Rhizopus arrhizus]KAG1417251.1 hypothetical protein G6F58_005599 [Rhizopus delemar]KAG0989501.1 hypothetical protein G6F29_000942 [Rhizopus arrhizus]KAG0999196.1 hypothetical protein G6F28_001227 [Rhizopus arrhizus]KAG1009358.1 hypothetical protein G6F27_005655 [Rhizopus arrhizus]